MKRFRGGPVFKAHRLVYHSTLGLRVIKKKKKSERLWEWTKASSARSPTLRSSWRFALKLLADPQVCSVCLSLSLCRSLCSPRSLSRSVSLSLCHTLSLSLQRGKLAAPQATQRAATGFVGAKSPKVRDSGRGTTRAEDAQGIPTQSHISPSVLVYEDFLIRRNPPVPPRYCLPYGLCIIHSWIIQKLPLEPDVWDAWSTIKLSSDDLFQETSARYRAVEPEQWLQRNPEEGSSWPSWAKASHTKFHL